MDDFGRVLDLCRRALEKGLDDDSRRFAEDLYTGTLVDRAAMLADAVLDARQVDQRWEQIRALSLRDLEEALGRDPRLGGAQLLVARLEALPGGTRAKAVAAARRALDLLGDEPLQRALATLVLAETAEDDDARSAHYDAAVELAPRDPRVRRARGEFHFDQKRYGPAREDLEVAVAEQPDDAVLQQQFGLACLLSDHPDEARRACDRAVELEPDDAGPLLFRARVAAATDDAATALADVERVLEMAPGNATALVLRAQVRQVQGEEDLALEDLDRVLESAPDAAGALELHGLLLAQREDYAGAIRDFRRLVARDPDNATLISQLGLFYLAASQPREALRRFSRALEIEADHVPSLRGRGDAALTIGDHTAALADLERALELAPDESGVLNNLAWLLATSPDDDLRDGARAVELAQRACERTEWKQSHIISTLAAGYAEQGDFETAMKYSRQAVETAKADSEERAQLEAELASYEARKPWRERKQEGEAAAPQPTEAAPRSDTAPVEPPREPAAPRRPFQDD